MREVLRAAALLGVDFAVPDLATVLGRGVADLIPAVDEARAAGVLAESGNGLGFRHPLIRAALYEEIPAPVRAAWHREAGRALAEAGAPADRVARQLLAGDQRASRRPGADGRVDPALAGPNGRRCWSARPPGPPRNSCGSAVARSPAGSPQHDGLTCRLAEALYRVGDAAEAERVASRASPRPPIPISSWTCTGRWPSAARMAGRFPESLAALNQALAHPGISARNRARLLVAIARTHRHLGQVEMAGQVAAAALAEATEADDDWAIGWALHVLTSWP